MRFATGVNDKWLEAIFGKVSPIETVFLEPLGKEIGLFVIYMAYSMNIRRSSSEILSEGEDVD